MATKTKKSTKKPAAPAAASALSAPAIITKKPPEGWVDQTLAGIGSESYDKLEAHNPRLRRQVEAIAKRRKDGNRDITARELNLVHEAGVICGLRRATH